MTSSTSNSSAAVRFIRTFLIAVLAMVGGLYAFILLVDPFDILAIGVPAERHPISTNQRFSYPALARSPDYNAVVLGTSTVRNLNPAILNPGFDARFANLAMNSGTAWEQVQILKQFLAANDDPRAILWGLDHAWCQENTKDLTFRPFPKWMYNDSPWDDYRNLLNAFTLEQAARQFAEMTGLRDRKYGKDGYTPVVPPDAEHDLDAVKSILWRNNPVLSFDDAHAAWSATAEQRVALDNTQKRYLIEALEIVPSETQVVLIFVPMHITALGIRSSNRQIYWRSCKDGIVEAVQAFENVTVLDFMTVSDLTASDANFWDPLHTTIGAGEVFAQQLIQGAMERRAGTAYEVLK